MGPGCNSAGKASLVMNVLLLLSLLFAGYLKDVDTITPVLRWLHYLSVFYYSFESMVVNEVSGLVFQFSVRSPTFHEQESRNSSVSGSTLP